MQTQGGLALQHHAQKITLPLTAVKPSWFPEQRLMSAARGPEDSRQRLHPSDQRDISAILKNYFLTTLIRHIAANVGQAAIPLVKD